MVEIMKPRPKTAGSIFTRPASTVAKAPVKRLPDTREPPADRVRVCVRLRPCSASEVPHWTHSNQSIHALDSPQPEFVLDSILPEISDNTFVYQQTCSNLVRNAMDGFNACAFAYGQTASGKTHTLSGTAGDPGLIPLAIADVFRYVSQHQDKVYLLRASYLEVFNESIRDLLTSLPGTSAGLNLRSDGDHVSVTGLRQEAVVNEEQVSELLRRGGKNRKTGGTEWNERSSRSHSVFQLIIESSSSNGGPTTTSTLSLIDLAGSEKASDNLERRSEGKNINRSLLTLGIVIGKLVENSRNKKTDSKLTRLLEPSLKGNAVVSVICTINPTSQFSEESLSTLQFATRVKKIKLNATKREDDDDTRAVLKQYQEEIKRLRQQLEEQRRGTIVDATSEEDLAMVRDRMEQLTNLILNSHSGSHLNGPARPVSPIKISASTISMEDQLFSAESQRVIQTNKIQELEIELARRPKIATGVGSQEMNDYVSKLEQEVSMLKIVIQDLEDTKDQPHAPLSISQADTLLRHENDSLQAQIHEIQAVNQRLVLEIESVKETNTKLSMMALGDINKILSPNKAANKSATPFRDLTNSPLLDARASRKPRRSTSMTEIWSRIAKKNQTDSLDLDSLLSEPPVAGMLDPSVRGKSYVLPAIPQSENVAVVSGYAQDLDYCDDVY